MRIAYDARYIHDQYHGIGRYAFRLLESLAALAPERAFVVFKGPARDSRFDWSGLEKRANVELREGPWPLYLPGEQLAWPRLLVESRADLFFTPYFPAPWWADIPRAITVHDLIFERYPAYMPSRWALPYYRLTMKLSARCARAVVAVSGATAADLARYYRVPSEKIAVVPEGVDPHFSSPIDESHLRLLRERYGLAERFILAVGARRPHKNFTRLVEAYARLDPQIPAQLVFAGPPDPRFRDEARQAAEKSGLDGRVRFLDWVPEADLPGLYRLAAVVALPSLAEGFGLPLLEAMACGVPVLAANTPALAELTGPAGLLVDPRCSQDIADGLRRLLLDEPLRAHLRAAGKERAARYTWEAAAVKILALFDRMLR